MFLPTHRSCVLLLFYPLVLNSLSAAEEVEFYRDIAPLFSKNCVACHNANLREGGLNLETHETLMSGGDSGDSIVAGQLEDSYLLSRVNGQEEPMMPPEDNSVGAKQLSESELKLLEAWIAGGAIAGQPMSDRSITWQDLPENLQPIYAVAASDDGQLLAFGRGNQLLVTSQSPGDSTAITALIDPALTASVAGQDETSNAKSHLDIVQSIAISPDSQRIASGGFRSVKIWKRSLTQETLLSGLRSEAKQALTSPDGKFLASVNPTIEIVNLETGFAFRFLSPNPAPIAAAAWIDSRHLLACDDSGQWYQFDATEPSSSVLVTEDSTEPIRSLHRLDADRILAINSNGLLLRCYVSTSDELQIKLEPAWEDQQIDALRVAGSNSELIVVAKQDGQLMLLRADSLEPLRTFDTGGPLDAFTVDRQGQRLVAVANGVAKLWDLSQDAPQAEISRDYALQRQVDTADRRIKRQNAKIEKIVANIDPLQKAADKEREALSKLQETTDKASEAVAARQKETQQAQSELDMAEMEIAAAEAAVEEAKKRLEAAKAERESKSKLLIAAKEKEQTAIEERDKKKQALAAAKESTDRAASLIPAQEREAEQQRNRLQAMRSEYERLLSESSFSDVVDVGFSQDGSHFVVSGEDGVLRVFSADQGKPLANQPMSNPIVALLPIAPVGRAANQGTPIDKLPGLTALTSDGRLVTVSLESHWQLERTIGDDASSPFSDRVTALAFSPDGQDLAVGSGPPSRFGDLSLLSVSDGSILQQLSELHSDSILTISYSPDGQQLATAGADKMCHLLDVATGQQVRSFEGHTHHVLGLDWRDDGQVLATASADATLKLWKAGTAEQLRTISNFSKEVTSLDFVGNSHQLVAACADGTVRLYNTDNGKQARVFRGAQDALFGVSVSQQGSLIFAGGQAGKIYGWDLESGKLLISLPNAASPVLISTSPGR